MISKLKHSPSVTPVLNVWEGRGGSGSDENMLEEVCVTGTCGWESHGRAGGVLLLPHHPPSHQSWGVPPLPLLSQEEHNYLWIKQGSCLLPETPDLQVGWLHNCTERQHGLVLSPPVLPPAVTPLVCCLVQTPLPRAGNKLVRA